MHPTKLEYDGNWLETADGRLLFQAMLYSSCGQIFLD